MTRTSRQTCAHCHGRCRAVDASGTSATLRCRKCRYFTLRIDRPAISMAIPLCHFHLDRGEGPWVRPLDDLRPAAELVKCLLDNLPFTQEMVENFGIRTEEHFAALQHAVEHGVTVYDLDRVMGDGRAITRLVGQTPNQPFPELTFPSTYEVILDEEDCEELSGWWREEG